MTVVVDHGALGGGVDQVCNAVGGGNDATSLFTGAGFSLTYVQRQPGFVCRINGQPASDPCVNTPPVERLLGALVVRREVRVVVLLLAGRRVADRPGRRLRRVRLADRLA